MIANEINKFREVLPSRIIDTRLDQNDMLVIHCEGFRVGIASDFEVELDGRLYTTPSEHLDAVEKLKSLKIQSVRLEYEIEYPDLHLEVGDRGYIRTHSDRMGHELWYIDVPGRLFITP